MSNSVSNRYVSAHDPMCPWQGPKEFRCQACDVIAKVRVDERGRNTPTPTQIAEVIQKIVAEGDAEWQNHNASCPDTGECEWSMPSAVSAYSFDGVTHTAFIEVDPFSTRLLEALGEQQ